MFQHAGVVGNRPGLDSTWEGRAGTGRGVILCTLSINLHFLHTHLPSMVRPRLSLL